jgi:hypothetical protein
LPMLAWTTTFYLYFLLALGRQVHMPPHPAIA